MSLEKAINELCINITSINITLLKMLELLSISSDTQLSSNINKLPVDCLTETANEIKKSPEAVCDNKVSLDQVRKSLNDVVKTKDKETAVNLLATFHNAKTLEDIEDHEYSNVVKKAKSILEAS